MRTFEVGEKVRITKNSAGIPKIKPRLDCLGTEQEIEQIGAVGNIYKCNGMWWRWQELQKIEPPEPELPEPPKGYELRDFRKGVPEGEIVPGGTQLYGSVMGWKPSWRFGSTPARAIYAYPIHITPEYAIPTDADCIEYIRKYGERMSVEVRDIYEEPWTAVKLVCVSNSERYQFQAWFVDNVNPYVECVRYCRVKKSVIEELYK